MYSVGSVLGSIQAARSQDIQKELSSKIETIDTTAQTATNMYNDIEKAGGTALGGSIGAKAVFTGYSKLKAKYDAFKKSKSKETDGDDAAEGTDGVDEGTDAVSDTVSNTVSDLTSGAENALSTAADAATTATTAATTAVSNVASTVSNLATKTATTFQNLVGGGGGGAESDVTSTGTELPTITQQNTFYRTPESLQNESQADKEDFPDAPEEVEEVIDPWEEFSANVRQNTMSNITGKEAPDTAEEAAPDTAEGVDDTAEGVDNITTDTTIEGANIPETLATGGADAGAAAAEEAALDTIGAGFEATSELDFGIGAVVGLVLQGIGFLVSGATVVGGIVGSDDAENTQETDTRTAETQATDEGNTPLDVMGKFATQSTSRLQQINR